MALKATIFKAEIQVADLDRNHYSDHSLTLARHPSETDERMMVRLLAFALNADEEGLSFARGLSVDDEPDLWAKDLTGAIRTWIDVGLPDEKIVRRACGRSDKALLRAVTQRSAALVAGGGRKARALGQSRGDRPAGGGHAGDGRTGTAHHAPAVLHAGWAGAAH